MRELLRQHRRFFILATLAAFALRLFFFLRFPHVSGDSFVYGDIARNWLERGFYGMSVYGHVQPTDIRLPGYPAFLAFLWMLVGHQHYNAPMIVQMFVDVGTCFVVADLALRTVSERAARIAFLLCALCPFLASYAAAPLSETLAVFFAALALDCAAVGLDELEPGRMRGWIGCAVAIAASILLRPDGGILLIAIGGYLIVIFFRDAGHRRQTFRIGVLVLMISLAPLVPWTLRNWRVFHVFEPLAPRYANNPGEFVPHGFNRWVKTWIADYVSVEEVYWREGSEQIDPDNLPRRACDSAEQCDRTQDIISDYNTELTVTPEIDATFAALAQERIAHSRLRYYVWLPALRIADMWLRPRTELLPLDSRWWAVSEDPHDAAWGMAIGAANLFFVVPAVVGLVLALRGRITQVRYLGMMLAFVVVRSLFLGTLENPEPRYTLECFPVVLVLAAAAWSRWMPPLPPKLSS